MPWIPWAGETLKDNILAIQNDLPFASGTATQGWGVYNDTQYTSGSPLSLTGDTDTLLPNNKGSLIETYKQSNVTTYYNGTTITGREGDIITMTFDMKLLPTNANTTIFELWIDIGGAVGELYRRPVSFPKGVGVERSLAVTTVGYTLDTWEANGATVWCRANNTCNVYDIRYIIERKQYNFA